jgi:hypothetical protein
MDVKRMYQPVKELPEHATEAVCATKLIKMFFVVKSTHDLKTQKNNRHR